MNKIIDIGQMAIKSPTREEWLVPVQIEGKEGCPSFIAFPTLEKAKKEIDDRTLIGTSFLL